MSMKVQTMPQLLVFVVTFVINLVEGLLGIRILLKLFGASPRAPFVDWVYDTTDSLLAPFAGMFPAPTLEGGFVIEFSALIALVVYAFLGFVIIQAVESLMYYSSRRVRPADPTDTF